MNMMNRYLFLFVVGVLVSTAMQGRGGDSLRLREDNIREVVNAMTLREKTMMVTGGGWNSLFSGLGIPFYGKPRVKGAAGTTHGIKRLGIPSTVLSDGPAGVRISPKQRNRKEKTYGTAFPVGCLLACTWDEELVREVGRGIGREAAERGIDVMLSPGVNIMRNPLCGRNYEYYSEDPLVSGQTAAAMIQGLQSMGVGACIKHFAANNQETNRKKNNSVVDETTLREIYLKPFEIAIRRAKPWTLMTSYNRLNGELTSASKWLLSDVLRGEWGYDGMVMTDWCGGTRPTSKQIAAGNDLMMPGMFNQRMYIRWALRTGRLKMQDLDSCVARVLRYVVKTRSYRTKYGQENVDEGLPPYSTAAQAALSRRAATEGMVLLKNDGETLPLAKDIKRVGLFGATSYELIGGGCGSGFVHKHHTVNLDEALEAEGYEIPMAMAKDYRKYAKRKKNRMSSNGMGMLSKYMGHGGLRERELEESSIRGQEAVTDVALITIGRQTSEGKDRRLEGDFLLTDVEQRLIDDVCRVYHAAGKRVVVVLNVNGVVETASWKAKPDAIVLAWQPGQEAGYAIMDILTGRVNPSGCLTMTWPMKYGDVPSAANFPLNGETLTEGGDGRFEDRTVESRKETIYKEGIEVGYRYYDGHGVEVSFPFGYGLSYTTFEETVVRKEDGSVWVEVRNTGEREGRHVVKFWEDGVLKGYVKTRVLKAGEREEVLEVKAES